MGPQERIDDLGGGIKLIQRPDLFCYGMDAVLLAGFVISSASFNLKKNTNIVDMCTGNGVVALFLSKKRQDINLYGIEIQKQSYDLLRRNISLNKLEDRICPINADILNKNDWLPLIKQGVDIVTANPPYMLQNEGKFNTDQVKAVARHEIKMTFSDLAEAAALCLREFGTFYLVHRPRRLPYILEKLREYKLEPKRIRFVHSYCDKEANLVLIEAVKGAGAQLTIDAPLIVYKDKDSYTDEIKNIYKNI